MVYIVLNFILAAFFICHTVYVDKIENTYDDGTNPVITNILIMAITTVFFSVFICLHSMLPPGLFSFFIKLCFFLEGCMFVNIAICFPYYAWKHMNTVMMFFKYLLYVAVFWIVIFKFKEIRISFENGISIRSDYIFSAKIRSVLPWTWETVYKAVFCYIIPAFCCLLMLVRNEMKATKLERYKGHIYLLGLISMWLVSLFINAVAKFNPPFSLLHFFAYPAMLIIIHAGARQTSAQSGRSIGIFIARSFILYVSLAVIMGFVFMFGMPVSKSYTLMFFAFCFVLACLISVVINLVTNALAKSKLGRSSDYASFFEQDLASIDYNGEMDEIENSMFQILRKNTECSSMAVFINDGQGILKTAYSSNGKKYSFSQNDPLFENLLNVGKNVVVYSEVETLYILSPFKDKLVKFFNDTESDALFILNEGSDVHGFIILGNKVNMDHYNDYDLQVFTKLYSYFFVFGYYMRNISNKEIIGTINRELRMSSQIITSIQENIDPVNNPKIDAGCVMIPAHNIGGEFVDMIRLTDTRHLFVVGDLSGKGIAASMSMVILKFIIRAYLAETHDFKELVVKINSFIRYNLQKGTIFAGMFAIVNLETDTMYYINCGIPAIFLYTEAYNNVIEIQGSGHILGFVSDISPYISVKQIKLNRNDIVLTCTDGLIEAHSLRGEQYGKDRIQRNMVANAMYPAQRMAQFAYDNLAKFMSKEMEDDISVLVMKYLKSDEDRNDDVVPDTGGFLDNSENTPAEQKS